MPQKLPKETKKAKKRLSKTDPNGPGVGGISRPREKKFLAMLKDGEKD